MAPRKLQKKLRKEEKVKKAITIEKKKEVVQTYDSGVRVTDFANMYSKSKSTISTILQIFVGKTHPDREKANRCIHLLNDNVMSYYRTVLKKKQKETTLDQFLVPKRLRPNDPEAGPSGLQTLPRRERTPESQLLFLVGFLWEFRNAL